MGGVSATLKFSGESADYSAWAMRATAHLQAARLWHTVHKPIAGSEEEVRALLVETSENESDGEGEGTKSESAASSSTQPPEAPETTPPKAPSRSSSKKKKSTKKEMEQKEKLVQSSREAYAFLLRVLPDDQLMLVASAGIVEEDTHAVWSFLKSTHQRTTTATRFHTRSLLQSSRLEKGERIDTYLARIKDLERRLKSMGSKVLEDELIHAVLKGLPPAWSSVVEAIEGMESVTWKYVVDRLRDTENKRRIAKEETAHFVRASGGGGGKGGKDSNSSMRMLLRSTRHREGCCCTPCSPCDWTSPTPCQC